MGSSSASSNSASNNLLQLKKNEELKKTPRLIGIFKKLFIIYFLIFLALSSAMIYMSYSSNLVFLEDEKTLHTSIEIFTTIGQIQS